MRPVSKGASPIIGNFNSYKDAINPLLDKIGIGEFRNIQLGQYCSYCERNIQTGLAVEHIEPKDDKPNLEKKWTNFLLACVNCNSTKGKKKINLNNYFLPDRDNTFIAFDYLYNGEVIPKSSLNPADKIIAKNTIELVGLNNPITTGGYEISKDRRKQRIDIYTLALDALSDYENDPTNEAVKKSIIKDMVSNGYFSIWMKVFERYPSITKSFITAIRGTTNSACFNQNGSPITPHPNTDNLQSGSKI
jgi:uncharacterized protein (TIGR02646 family)